MPQIIKHSIGGIVIDPKTEKMLVTKKLAKKEYAAKFKKKMYSILRISPEEVIKKTKNG